MTILLSKDMLEYNYIYLTREATYEEIYQTLTQINHLKALGPNSVHAVFYQKCWQIIGKNISLMVRSS